jgi:hypothetical protein
VFIEKFDDYIADYVQFMDAVLQKHPHLKDLPRFLSGYHAPRVARRLWRGITDS